MDGSNANAAPGQTSRRYAARRTACCPHVVDDVGVGGLVPRHRSVVERALGHVASRDAEVEGPIAGFEGVAVAEPLELLVFFGEGVPNGLEGDGVVAGEGEPGAGESACD